MTAVTPELAPPSSVPGHPRLLAAPSPDLSAHLAVHGALPPAHADGVLLHLDRSGLTGRGGAGFPAAVKMRGVAERSGGQAVVVGNGAEGEPASDKDRQLLTLAPHLVLDGLQLAAVAVAAAQLILYVRADAVAAVRRAIAERRGLDRLPVTVVEAGPGFVAGQETAVVSRLNGGAAVPQFARDRVGVRGVAGRPTLVQNVETLAHLALIVRYGSSTTFLATVHAPLGLSRSERPAQARAELPAVLAPPPAVWEVPRGTTVRNLLRASAAGAVDDLQAVLVGGYHGTWLHLPEALDAPLSREGLAPWGAGVGAGVVVPITSSACGLDVTAQIVRYLAAESARQCGPCQFGLPHLARMMSGLAAGAASRSDLAALRTAAGLVEGRGACGHPDGTARLVRSALIAFEQDVVLHGHGRCMARIAGGEVL